MFEILIRYDSVLIFPQQVVPIIPMSIRIRQFFALYPGASQPLEAKVGTAESRSEFLTFQSQQETQLPEDHPHYVASPEVVCVSEKPGELPPAQEAAPRGPRGSIIREKPQKPEGVSGDLTGKVDLEAQAKLRKSIEAAEGAIPKAKAKASAKSQAQKRAPKAKAKSTPKKKGLKRSLESDFAAAAEADGSHAPIEEQPVVPSPKARKMAGRGDPLAKAEASKVRQEKAIEGLSILEDASLPGLTLPSSEFAKL